MVIFLKQLFLCGSTLTLLTLLLPPVSLAGAYLDSAHGDSSSGVYRTSTSALGYSQGNCAHCHEQHASIEGTEPAPASPTDPAPNPNKYTLFYDNFIGQTDGVCLRCHISPGSDQSTGSVNNYSYSYQAGGWTVDTLNDIFSFFSFSSSGNPTYYPSSHNLSDISTFIQTQAWGYTADSNPCIACHNPHAAQKDDKTGTRGWPLSLPSDHGNTPWDLWGNASGELMNAYAPPPTYQAPYYFGSSTNYEPDNSTTTDGSNLVDSVTFCLDCHANTIASTTLGRNIPAINWGSDVHGARIGRASNHNKGTLIAPYNEASGSDYVLSCLDCHEPHGSPNTFLLRSEINGVQIVPPSPTAAQVITANNSTSNWPTLCAACHNVTATAAGNPCNNTTNHSNYAAPAGNCSSCHGHGQTFCGPGSGGTTYTF